MTPVRQKIGFPIVSCTDRPVFNDCESVRSEKLLAGPRFIGQNVTSSCNLHRADQAAEMINCSTKLNAKPSETAHTL